MYYIIYIYTNHPVIRSCIEFICKSSYSPELNILHKQIFNIFIYRFFHVISFDNNDITQ